MRVVHVIASIQEEAAGPSYSVPRLCQSLAERGHFVELNCQSTTRQVPGVRLSAHAGWRFPNHVTSSLAQARSLWRKTKTADVIHNHGLWAVGNVVAGLAVPGHRAKLVTSPRGMLRTWALNWHKNRKRALWPVQRQAVERASLLHATSEVECAELRSLGLVTPVAIIPNGIDIAHPLPPSARNRDRVLLYLSRLHPSKGPDRLLKAWAEIQARHVDWRLVVAGSGDSRYETELQALAAALRLERVAFPGPVYGDAKSAAYFTASLFVLPTHTENFGMVVAEALAHECPVIVSRGAPWPNLGKEKCGWWIGNDVRTLAETLDHAMSLPMAQLTVMGVNGRKWMEKTYAWSSVAEQMEHAYLWITRGGPAPPFIDQR